MSYELPDIERLLRFREPQQTSHVISSFAVACVCIILATFFSNYAISLSPGLNRVQYKARRAIKEVALRGFESIGLPTDILTKVTLPLARSGLDVSRLEGDDRPNKPAGLDNPANGCFQNSVIQGLASLQSLPAFLEEIGQLNSDNDRATSDMLAHIIRVLNEGGSGRMSYRLPSRLSNMNVWQQQDAQEYYTKLYDRVEKEVIESLQRRHTKEGLRYPTVISPHNGYPSGHPSGQQSPISSNPLEGFQAQRVCCTTCGFSEGLSITPLNCLTLQLEGYVTQRLDRLLNEWTKVDYIEDVECGNCTLEAKRKLVADVLKNSKMDSAKAGLQTLLANIEHSLKNEDFSEETLLEKCNVPKNTRIRRTKTKQIAMARPPKALVVHFNRSVFTQWGDQVKNNAPIHFESQFDMRPWCLGASEDEEQKYELIERWNMGPEVSMLPVGTLLASDPSTIYHLKAVVQHQGSADNGHYVCYRKFKSDDKKAARWFVMNDAHVYPTDEERVLSEHGTFMLFYERSDDLAISQQDTSKPEGQITAEGSKQSDDSPVYAEKNVRIDSKVASQRSSLDIRMTATVTASA